MKMDALKFIEERNRMCVYYNAKDADSGCVGCPASQMACSSVHYVTAEYIEAVEKWSQEHPRKTRQDVFLEQWPEAALDEYGVLQPCPADISAAYRDTDGDCKIQGKRCKDCCREFWMQEVE